MPTTTNRGRTAGLLLAGALVLGAGCTSSPHVGAGTLAQAKARVLAEVDTAATTAAGADRPSTTPNLLACDERLLGYTIKHLRERRAEVRGTLNVKSGDGAAVLPRVEKEWKARGYTVDDSGLSDHRYPKIRTNIGPDLVVVTGYVGASQVNLYAVSPCVKQ